MAGTWVDPQMMHFLLSGAAHAQHAHGNSSGAGSQSGRRLLAALVACALGASLLSVLWVLLPGGAGR